MGSSVRADPDKIVNIIRIIDLIQDVNNNNKANIAWFTSTRGVYLLWYDGLLSSETDESPFNNLFQPKLEILVYSLVSVWHGLEQVVLWFKIGLLYYFVCTKSVMTYEIKPDFYNNSSIV